MAFTNGTLYGRQNGSTLLLAFNSSNATNPNAQPPNDLFQIIDSKGGNVLLNVTAAGVVHAPSVNPTTTAQIAKVSGTAVLGTTAALVCQGTFPENYANQQLDLFQVSSDIELNAVEGVAGGGAVIYRLTYAGAAATS